MDDSESTKKELGQHWLKDPSILTAIAEAAELTAADTVLEIGPGLGTLTSVLATRAHVRALEFDRDLIAKLQRTFKNNQNVDVMQGDIRTFDFSSMPAGYKIVANIPYYLTSHLIRSISETENPPAKAVLLIQKEVAERICAAPGSMSILSVTAQFYFECMQDIVVPARFFTPPPKVDSQVIVLKRRPNKLFDVDEGRFFQVVKAGFSEKRKTLRNSISGGLRISKDDAVQILERAGVSPGARAQQLSLDEWYAIYDSVQAFGG